MIELKPTRSKTIRRSIERYPPDISVKKSSIVKLSKLLIPTSDGVEFVPINEVMFLKSDGNYCEVHLCDSQNLFVAKTLKYFVSHLSAYNFLRIHQSYFINIDYIRKYIKKEGGYIILENGIEVPVSRHFKQNLTAFISG